MPICWAYRPELVATIAAVSTLKGWPFLQDVIERIATERIDSTQDTTDNLRAFVKARLSNVLQVQNADVEKARGEIARHVSRIEMKPVRSPGERGHYVATGNWNLLGAAFEKIDF